MSDKHTIGSILQLTAGYLRERGISSAKLDAEVLLAHVLVSTRIQLYMNYDKPLQAAEIDRYREVVRERARRIPVAYIVGSKEFMSLGFCVGKGVLIPRPDTEVLVSAVLTRVPVDSDMVLVDVGTGSGAIAVAILVARPKAKVFAVDISEEALGFARLNAIRHGVDDRMVALKGDLLQPILASDGAGCIGGIISNPPYIPERDIDGLEPEVSAHEPRLALAGGRDGLDVYRRILGECAVNRERLLPPGGFIAFEVGFGQADDVRSLAAGAIPDAQLDVVKDYAGIDRVVVVETAPIIPARAKESESLGDGDV